MLDERLPFEVLHGDEVRARLLAHFVGVNDVGVAEAGGEPRLLEEHRGERRVRGVICAEALDDRELVEAHGAARDRKKARPPCPRGRGSRRPGTCRSPSTRQSRRLSSRSIARVCGPPPPRSQNDTRRGSARSTGAAPRDYPQFFGGFPPPASSAASSPCSSSRHARSAGSSRAEEGRGRHVVARSAVGDGALVRALELLRRRERRVPGGAAHRQGVLGHRRGRP